MLSQGKRRKGGRVIDYSHACELLEQRTLLSSVAWTGTAGDGNWATAGNWSSDAVPGAGDDVTIPSGTGTITISSGSQAVNTLTANQSIAVSGGSLSVAQASQINSSLLLSGTGAITGDGDLTVSGSLVWSGGTMSGSGKTIVATGGTLQLGSGSNADLLRTLENDGTATWTSNTLVFDNGVIANFGSWTANSDSTLYAEDNGSGETNAFDNYGTFTKTGAGTADFGSSSDSSGVPFNNAGTILESQGSLQQNSGGTRQGSLLISMPSSASAPTTLGTQSTDEGNTIGAFAQSSTWGYISVAAGTYLKLNDPTGTGKVLYVDDLVVQAGATLDLSGIRLYTQVATIDPSATIKNGIPSTLPVGNYQPVTNISSNTELSSTSTPYLLLRGLTIPAGVTLTIDAGVTVIAYPGSLAVAGNLISNGGTINFNYSTTLTNEGVNELTVEPGGTFNATGGSINGAGVITAFDRGIVNLNGVQFGTNPLPIDPAAATLPSLLTADNATGSVTGCSGQWIFEPSGSGVIATSNTLYEITLQSTSGVPEFTDNTFTASAPVSEPLIPEDIDDITQADPLFASNTFDSGKILTVPWAQSGTVPDGHWLSLPDADVVYYEPDASTNIAGGSTDTYDPGVIIKVAGNYYNPVPGTAIANGTASRPVIFTSIKDDSAGGDTRLDGPSTPAAGDWVGFVLSANASAQFNHVEIRYATIGINANESDVNLQITDSVVTDCSQYGIYAYTQGVVIDATNCIVADNGYTGIFLRADSPGDALLNCTVVGNGLSSDGEIQDEAGVEVGATTTTIQNCIIAFNYYGLVHGSSSAGTDSTDLTVDHSLFYNPGSGSTDNNLLWDTSTGEPDLTSSGNLTSDPTFVGYAAGNYELDANSPAIDAGDSTGAPETDELGLTRFDDPGVANTGVGTANNYTDIGALERQTASLSLNLTAAAIYSSTQTIEPGGAFTVNWSERNTGQATIPEGWTDTVYLSQFPYASTSDLLLGQVTQPGGVAVGAAETGAWTGNVPSTAAGPYYLRVYVDSSKSISESNVSDNTSISTAAVAVGVGTLTTAAPVTSSVSSQQWTYFQIAAKADTAILFNVTSTAASGSLRLFVRYNTAPDLLNFDATSGDGYSLSPQLMFDPPNDGTYYLGVYGDSIAPGAAGFSLSEMLLPDSIRGVSPSTVDNQGSSTFEVKLDDPDPTDSVALISAQTGSQILGRFADASSQALYATFNLAGATAGTYTLQVMPASGSPLIASNPVTVVGTATTGFTSSIDLPSTERPAHTETLTVQYSNTGTSDITSPLMTLSDPMESDTVQWLLPDSSDWITGPTLKFLALSSTGPADILRPGQTESIQIKVKTPFRQGDFHIAISDLTPADQTPIDWATWYSSDVAVSRAARLGTTWGQYVQNLDAAASVEALNGRTIYSATSLEADVSAPSTTANTGSAAPSDSTSSIPAGTLFLYSPTNVGANDYPTSTGYNFIELSQQDAPQYINQNASLPVVVIIHGWLNSVLGSRNDWVGRMASDIYTADRGQVDVIAVDWSQYSSISTAVLFAPEGGAYDVPPADNPFEPAGYIPTVAENAFNNLTDFGLADDVYHVIGHSHGAHIAGLLCNKLRDAGHLVPRLTVLDPSTEDTHFEAGNFLGRGWGPTSAAFVDEYKSSAIAGGDTSWGTDCFLLVEDGDVWGNEPLTDYVNDGAFSLTSIKHNYSVEWYIGTILDGGGSLGLGYNWGPSSWAAAISSFQSLVVAPFADDLPWKGMIRGPFIARADDPDRPVPTDDDSTEVIETLSESQFRPGTGSWFYGGPWDTSSDMLDSLAQSVDMSFVSNSLTAEADSDTGQQQSWTAGGDGEVDYTLSNAADNSNIDEETRFDAQGDIDDSIYLSTTPTLDVNPDDHQAVLLDTLSHDSGDDYDYGGDNSNFLDVDGTADFNDEVDLPSESDIVADFNQTQLATQYYIIVDSGSTLSDSPYEGELYPNDNVADVPIVIEGDTFTANAGGNVTVTLPDGASTVDVTLNGSDTAPSDDTVMFDWSDPFSSDGEQGATATLGVGAYNVSLTVTDVDTGKTASDVATVTVLASPTAPDGNGDGSGDTTLVGSDTPEDLYGPPGYDAPNTAATSIQRFVLPNQAFNYRIEYWNLSDPNTPYTQEATIQEALDPHLDWTTLELTGVGFDGLTVHDQTLSGGQSAAGRVDISPDLSVDFTAALNTSTGELTWHFNAVDPTTGEAPDGLDVGFLPPYTSANGYPIGWIDYSIMPKASLPTGTTIGAQAQVEFDYAEDFAKHLAPEGSPWVNTIDSVAPTSTVSSLPEITETASFPVAWSGSDVGSGVAHYDLYVSEDGGSFTPWLLDTTQLNANFSGALGHSYSFYSVATDNVGNVQPTPAMAQAATQLLEPNEFIPFSSKLKAKYTDSAGNLVTVSLSGPGSGQLGFYQGGSADPITFVLSGTTAASRLSISVKKGFADISNVQINGSLADFDATKVNLTGNFSVTGTLGILALGNADSGISNIEVQGAAIATTFTFGTLQDVSLTANGGVKSLSALQWNDGTFSADSLTAPWIKAIKTNGNFDAAISTTASGLTSFSAGSISAGVWNITGNGGVLTVGSISAGWAATFTGDLTSVRVKSSLAGSLTARSLLSLTCGSLNGATIRLSGSNLGKRDALTTVHVSGNVSDSNIDAVSNIGNVTVGGMSNSNLFAGISAGTTGLPSSSDFAVPSDIASFRIIGNGPYTNSDISAASIGAVALRNVTTANSGTAFGISTRSLKIYSLQQTGEKTFLWNSKNPISLLAEMPGDLKIEVS